MKGFPRTTALYASFLLALTLSAVGCKSNQNANSNQASTQPSSSDQSQQPADQSEQAANQIQSDQSDPANSNIVPISNTTTGTGAATGAASSSGSSGSSGSAASGSSASGSTAAPSGEQASGGEVEPNAQINTAQYNEDNGYGQEPETYAQQPPPELPQYQQPACPGPGYIWTPGNWRWAQPAGYYWTPGAWVHAPYEGALWTPGYWGWRGGRYAYYRGYWGRHVGFYGGINYGFGYVGFGYHGGYWRGNDFMYNRAVNNINVTVVRNVYEYKVVNITNTRVSFNGGNGGIRYRPRPVELIATVREQHNPPMQAQIQIRENAERDRQNFASENRGRPAMVVVDHPVQADRNVRPPAPVNYRVHAQPPARPVEAPPGREQQPGRPVPQQHPGQPEQRGGQSNRPEPNRQLQGGRGQGPNKQLQEHNQQHPVPHQPTPQQQHAGPNHQEAAHQQGAHPQQNHQNEQQKKNDKKKKPEDQRPQ